MDGADRLPLDLLSQREATSLVATICDDARVAAEPRAADRLVELCGRLAVARGAFATLGDAVGLFVGRVQ